MRAGWCRRTTPKSPWSRRTPGTSSLPGGRTFGLSRRGPVCRRTRSYTTPYRSTSPGARTSTDTRYVRSGVSTFTGPTSGGGTRELRRSTRAVEKGEGSLLHPDSRHTRMLDRCRLLQKRVPFMYVSWCHLVRVWFTHAILPGHGFGAGPRHSTP